MIVVEMRTGRAVRKSGSGGKKKMMEVRDVVIERDASELARYNRCKYLPHMGDKQKDKAAKKAGIV